MKDKLQEQFQKFEIKDKAKLQVLGGTHNYCTGNRSFEGKTWFDYEERNGEGDVTRTHCNVADWIEGHLYEIGEEIG